MICSILSIVCIVLMIAIVIITARRFVVLNRSEKIDFIKNFKKGQCFIIYIVALPLFIIAYLSKGADIGVALFNSISEMVQLILLKYNISNYLILDNVFFSIAIYLCFSLVVINAGLFIVSILYQLLWERLKYSNFCFGKKDKCIILGYNKKSENIYKTCKCDKILVDVLDKDKRGKLLSSDISYKSFISNEKMNSWLFKYFIHLSQKKIRRNIKLQIIVNYGEDKKNLSFCGEFLRFLKSKDAVIPVEFVKHVDIYVFGNREFEDVYAKYEKNSNGYLHYINEYREIAIDFIDKYPLTEFMTSEQVDYETSLIKKDVDLNVSLIGFGRTNQQIFLSMVSNHQFLTEEEGKIVNKKVNYFLFDKNHTSEHKNLNHNYYRYQYNFYDEKKIIDKSLYLELPELPANEKYCYLDINNNKFYDEVINTISFNKISINYCIVSLGNDYLNIDITNKLITKFKELKIDNVYLFVCIKDKTILKDYNIFIDNKNCFAFGCEEKVQYDYTHAVNEKFVGMAIMQNFSYDIEHDFGGKNITSEIEEQSKLKWYKKRSIIEKESNIYACLSLKIKLQLMGLDIVDNENSLKGLSQEEFFNIYAKNDLPEFRDSKEGYKAIEYFINYKNSRRKTMAMIEHNRWNAYMIMQGFIPAQKEEILTELVDGKLSNGKNYEMRHHGNLTTWEGLIKFREMIAKRDNIEEKESDVIKYDYQILDGAWWLLNKNGYKIIKRDK